MARTGQQLRRRTAKAVQERKSAGNSPKRSAAAPKSDLGDRLRYWFDNSMSRGTPALVA